jgi:hypothetical protein
MAARAKRGERGFERGESKEEEKQRVGTWRGGGEWRGST